MPTTKRKQAAEPALPIPNRKQAPVPPPPDAVFISAKQLRNRYGARSEMWLVRKLESDPDFPRPMYSGRLRFFRLDELERYEKLAVTRGKPDAKAEASAKATV